MKKAVLFVVILLAPTLGQARIITVDADGPADFNNIQAAIDDANDGDTVEIQPGTYSGPGNGDIDFKGKAITVRSTDPNDPNIVAATIISGGRFFRVIRFFTEEDPNTVLDGLTIGTMGQLGPSAIECYGASPTIRNCTFNFRSGAIYCTDAAPIIEDCSFISCSRAIRCAEAAPTIKICTFISCSTAIYCDGAGPTIESCTFTSCSGSYGAAIYCTNAGPTIKDCIISSSSAEDYGGAIYCEQASSPTIDNCVFTNNSAQIGGAIYFLESTSTISHCTFRSNSATVSSGGAVRINESAVTIIDSIFEGNSAQSAGGGINCSEEGAELILNNCVFRGCSSPIGGALCGVARPMTITNCIFAGNWTAETERRPFSEGGALAIGAGDMANCLFIGNSALNGGAVVGSGCGDLTISNCTFAGNRAFQANTLYACTPTGLDKLYDCLGGNISIADSIIWDGQDTIVNGEDDRTITLAFCDVSGGQNSVYDPCNCVTWGPGNIDADPCFAHPGYWDSNGTPDDANDDFWVDGDYHLKSEAGRWDANEGRWTIDEVMSPCIDAGDPMTPIMHEPFPNGGIVNMGAYGGTTEASRSYFGEPLCETIVAGDINGDCEVNFLDFHLMALHWTEEH